MDNGFWFCGGEFIVSVADQFAGFILRLCGKVFPLQVSDRFIVFDF